MLIQQISVFIENTPGVLAEVTDILSTAQVDITALSLADTSDFGVLRLIVDKPDLAQRALKDCGFAANSTEVLAVAMADQPGGLASIVRKLSTAGISIEYMYAFVGKKEGKAIVVVRVNDNNAASKALSQINANPVTARDIYNL